MDESWRMRMGMNSTKPNISRRKSTEETSQRAIFGDSGTLDAEDFDDVFGGPPRSVLLRQFSGGDFTTKSSFYEEIFRPLKNGASAGKNGLNLPEFRIPGSRSGRGSEEFYSDVFLPEEDVRRSRSRSTSKSKSKTSSSSVLSSEELSPLRPAIYDDDVSFSFFASKLRPINVPPRWKRSTMMQDVSSRQQGMPTFSCSRPSFVENQFPQNEFIGDFASSHFGFSRQVSSPETISLDPNSYGSVKVSPQDIELNSPSSLVSSLCQYQEVKSCKIQDKEMQEQDTDQEEDEVMGSYVIEINSDHREGTGEAHGIDEAIAWAKEKFQTHSSVKDWNLRQHEKEQYAEMEEWPITDGFSDGQIGGSGSMQSPVDTTEEENRPVEKDMEIQLLDEDISLWSAGKEANIQLLLSTLHHILWPNSGWYPISLTNLMESSHVKKAYQKARLCLHPDKLQQRAATRPQKYVAEKAFSILQDAWAAFMSQNVVLS